MPEPENTQTTVTPPTSGQTTQTTDTSANTSVFDTSKITDDQFEKVFDDPRLFKHTRFKNLGDRAKKADELEAQAKKDEEDKLKANQQFEELAKTKEQEATKWQEKYNDSVVDSQIVTAAAAKGAVDLEAVKKLINRGTIKIENDGTVSGVAEAIEQLTKDKAYLFNQGNGQTRVGGGTAPANGANGQQQFTMTQIRDARFYREHEKEIRQAMLTGNIVNDTGK